MWIAYWGETMASNKKKNRYKRQTRNREQIDKILIVCEGTETEPNYFKAFSQKNISLDVRGIGFNTLSLVEEAIKIKTNAKTRYNQIWCVFDRDKGVHLAKNFNQAFVTARQNQIKIAYTNDAFELWFLLHFDYITAALNRDEYNEKLSKATRLNSKYEKNDPNMYKTLKNKQKTAIRNAKKLYATYRRNRNPEKNDPSTTVYKLVEELNKYL